MHTMAPSQVRRMEVPGGESAVLYRSPRHIYAEAGPSRPRDNDWKTKRVENADDQESTDSETVNGDDDDDDNDDNQSLQSETNRRGESKLDVLHLVRCDSFTLSKCPRAGERECEHAAKCAEYKRKHKDSFLLSAIKVQRQRRDSGCAFDDDQVAVESESENEWGYASESIQLSSKKFKYSPDFDLFHEPTPPRFRKTDSSGRRTSTLPGWAIAETYAATGDYPSKKQRERRRKLREKYFPDPNVALVGYQAATPLHDELLKDACRCIWRGCRNVWNGLKHGGPAPVGNGMAPYVGGGNVAVRFGDEMVFSGGIVRP